MKKDKFIEDEGKSSAKSEYFISFREAGSVGGVVVKAKTAQNAVKKLSEDSIILNIQKL